MCLLIIIFSNKILPETNHYAFRASECASRYPRSMPEGLVLKFRELPVLLPRRCIELFPLQLHRR